MPERPAKKPFVPRIREHVAEEAAAGGSAEAVAKGVRKWVDKILKGPFLPGRRRAMMAVLPLALLGLGVGSEVKRYIEEERQMTADLRLYENRLIPYTPKDLPAWVMKGQEKLRKVGLVYDPVTKNFVAGEPAQHVEAKESKGPMVKFTLDGKIYWEGQKEHVIRFLKADDACFKATGRHFDLNEAFRTNIDQGIIKLTKMLKAILGKGGAAASPFKSFHLLGWAFDIGTNPTDDPKRADWHLAQPYLEAQGFIGGFRNGITPIDPGHFSIGEIDHPADEAKQQKLKEDYCKNPDNQKHCELMNQRQTGARGK